MIKKPKPQTLRDRIEKTQQLDTLDSNIKSYFNETLRALSTIGPMKSFDLKTPESAQTALKEFSATAEKINGMGRQVRAVKYLFEQQRMTETLSIDKPAWQDSDKPVDKKSAK